MSDFFDGRIESCKLVAGKFGLQVELDVSHDGKRSKSWLGLDAKNFDRTVAFLSAMGCEPTPASVVETLPGKAVRCSERVSSSGKRYFDVYAPKSRTESAPVEAAQLADLEAQLRDAWPAKPETAPSASSDIPF
jgi:hypothetical protein